MKRGASRGHYDRETVYAILDEGLVGHVGFVADGQPFVIPMSYGRMDDHIVLHGSHEARLNKIAKFGEPVCFTVTILDGLVLGKSIMHHSMNYRSVVVFGKPEEVTDTDVKARALKALIEHVIPNRYAEGRTPNENELEATSVLLLPITEASAKIRTGPPVEPQSDRERDGWSGVIPITLTPGDPIPSDDVADGTPIARSVATYHRPGGETEGG
jgi:nitroimidazol reductase NimA-like FMN-containing flavoprotein (pyridoxamine 5'-phosphate oxidase superfamily)